MKLLNFLNRFRRDEPQWILMQTNDILIKGARRCAYDLKHAADEVKDPELHWMFKERANFWVELFQSGSSVKAYRNKLGLENSKLLDTVFKLRQVLEKHGIEDPTRLPF